MLHPSIDPFHGLSCNPSPFLEDDLDCNPLYSQTTSTRQSLPPVTQPSKWETYLSPWEQSWVGSLFRTVQRGGLKCAELRPLKELWCRPPPPPLVANTVPPGPDCYFGAPLLFWLPRRIWGVLLACPECGDMLTSFGPHKCLRKVIDLQVGYWMATERLVCPQCRPQKIYTAWDHRIVRPLDMAHQQQFPAVLTQK